jgi:hypothetical protein
MPTGRKSRKADDLQALPEQTADTGKDPAAMSLGSRGGRARAKVLTAKRRVQIARKAAIKRWSKD